MNDTPRKTTVSLEDLLRLKRAEQPPAEFWAEFERGMRTKQLAAIVEPRPWWSPFIRVGARLARYQLPVGATAILAVTLLTIREYHPASPAPVFEPAAAEMASLTTPAPAEEKAIAVDSVSAPAVSGTLVVAAAAEPAPAVAASDSRADQVAPAPSASTALGTTSHVAMVNSGLTSARYMADNLANLAATRPTDPNLDQMLGRSLDSGEGTPVRTEPLAQISVPSESHLYRLLGGAARLASTSTGDSALRVNEQAARHLTERRLSESDLIGRLDVVGSRVTVKF